MQQLPSELVSQCFTFLDLKDLCDTVSPVCRHFNQHAKGLVYGQYGEEYAEVCKHHRRFLVCRFNSRAAIRQICNDHAGFRAENGSITLRNLVHPTEFKSRFGLHCNFEMYEELRKEITDIALSRWRAVVRLFRGTELSTKGIELVIRIFEHFANGQNGLDFESFRALRQVMTIEPTTNEYFEWVLTNGFESDEQRRLTINGFFAWFEAVLSGLYLTNPFHVYIYEILTKFIQVTNF